MAQLDLAIRGGTIVTTSDEFRADIGVRDGRIVSIADQIEGASREIDATGLFASAVLGVENFVQFLAFLPQFDQLFETLANLGQELARFSHGVMLLKKVRHGSPGSATRRGHGLEFLLDGLVRFNGQ